MARRKMPIGSSGPAKKKHKKPPSFPVPKASRKATRRKK